jgi:hypothetical protein
MVSFQSLTFKFDFLLAIVSAVEIIRAWGLCLFLVLNEFKCGLPLILAN